MAKMSAKTFARYVARDGSSFSSGVADDTMVPNHRINRQMGGSQLLNFPANIVTMDSHTNGLIESDAAWRRTARERGWKLETWEDPVTTPAFHVLRGWLMLDNEFGTRPATLREIVEWENHVEHLG